MKKTIDIICIGEVLIDFIGHETNTVLVMLFGVVLYAKLNNKTIVESILLLRNWQV